MKRYLRIWVGFSLLFIAILPSCEKNHKPEILQVFYSPSAGIGGTIFSLTARAIDPDGDSLNYFWTVEDGSLLEGCTSSVAKWMSPIVLLNQSFWIKVSVTDGIEAVTETTQVLVGKNAEGQVSGIVYFEGCSIPISGVTVKIGKKTAKTELDGSYMISGIIVGNHTLEASKPDFESFFESVEVRENDTTVVDVYMTSKSHTSKIEGIVKDLQGKPVKNAEVIMLNPDQSESDLTYVTLQGGLYELLSVPNGERTIEARIFGCRVFQETVVVAGDFQYNIQLSETICIDSTGRSYETVKIGEQFWMAENLAYLPAISDPADGSDEYPYYYVYNYYGTSVSEARESPFYKSIGVLYNWVSAKSACPPNWHLPSNAEWIQMIDYLIDNGYGYGGSGDYIGKSLASTSGWYSSTYEWAVGNNQRTNNSSGFNVYPGGIRTYDGTFNDICCEASFWSGTPYGGAGYYWYMNSESPGIYQYNNYRRFGFSVRCIKD